MGLAILQSPLGAFNILARTSCGSHRICSIFTAGALFFQVLWSQVTETPAADAAAKPEARKRLKR